MVTLWVHSLQNLQRRQDVELHVKDSERQAVEDRLAAEIRSNEAEKKLLQEKLRNAQETLERNKGEKQLGRDKSGRFSKKVVV